MKTIVAGSRSITDYKTVHSAIYEAPWIITEVVSGGAPGVDTLGEQAAAEFGIPVKLFPADWNKHRRAAGPIRNQQMAEYADALIAIWDGVSNGTADMIRRAKHHKLRIHIIKVPPPWEDLDEFGF